MIFIKVTAEQCNTQGLTSPQIPRSEFQLSLDLVGAFVGDKVLLKGGEMINLGGHWYKNFRLVSGQKIPN